MWNELEGHEEGGGKNKGRGGEKTDILTQCVVLSSHPCSVYQAVSEPAHPSTEEAVKEG